MDAIPFRRRLCAGLALPALAWALVVSPAAAASPPAAGVYDIPAGPLDAALTAFAAQSHLQLLYAPELVAGRRSPGLHGAVPADLALAQVLGGAPITSSRRQPGVLVLKSSAASDGRASFPDAAAPMSEPTTLEALVVTGSHIRGAANPTSPIVDLDRDQMDRAGHATLAEALSALPQNFSGSGTPSTSLLSADPRSTNDTLATGVNLRGLGTSATLVLINGRRMAGAGLQGDFADISAIPTAAIKRVDVLLDGASAVYGSDAVGGVVNVILRRDFDGAESRIRLGGATQGGAAQTQIAQTFGKVWSSGDLLVAYEYEHRDHLAGSARAYTATSDLRPYGGSDHRLFYSHPATLLRYDAQSGAYVAAYAVPAGQDGTKLRPTDFLAGQANFSDPRAGGDLLPAQDRNSLYMGYHQDLTARLTLGLEGRYSQREIDLHRPALLAVFNITRANPWFVSPDGSSSQTIGYAFGDELGAPETTGSSKSLGLAANLDADLGAGWRGSISAALAQETGRRTVRHYLNTGFLNEALGAKADDPLTAFSAARDGYFNPYGAGTTTNSRAVLDFIGSGYLHTVSASKVTSLDAQADGPLFRLPGGEVKLALGVQSRHEAFKPQSESLTSRSTPSFSGGVSYRRSIDAAFAELRIPLIGPDNALAGVQALELTLAGRIERYDDVGRTSNPKLGLAWTPMDGVRVRASYGTSFRAPNLPEVFATPLIAPSFLTRNGANVLTLIRYGGNLDLKPERATSWTAGVDLAPPALPGLKVSLSAFDVVFQDQIGQPVLADVDHALTDPAYGPFVRFIDHANPTDVADLNALIAASTSSDTGLFPASAYGAIVDARYVNTAKVEVRGLDLSAAYGWQRAADRFELAGDLSYLADYRRKVTPSSPAVQLINLAGQPLRLRAHGALSWSRGAYGATLGLSFANPYRSPAGARISASTTADLQLRWTPTEDSGALAGLSLALTAQNLFDADPPFYDSALGVGYDPANGDPLGRQVSLQLTKRW
ncbi:TonB-dependent receptor [Phenylobacterium aquaticum]|uniref:TonB-dependent receptor n=1 Tax=Phenylobacterium aquaticum TaxID=1763816 RepID=UPI001F5DA4CD|nr:TonB-dependent receptor [Phenylobacterium aquaticum]MCI3135386.1 TonB-dependent receptor [Phenylobacterium aquaticum]